MISARARIKKNFPAAVAWWRALKYALQDRRSPARVFSDIYRHNRWGDPESVSGPGSSLARTAALRECLPGLIEDLGVRSLLDIPCGDFHWMSRVNLDVEYIGADIVEDLVRENQRKYGRPGRQFLCLDLLRGPLPKTDLLLCRDCLIHFSFRNIRRALKVIRDSGATFLLTTTYVDRTANEDNPTGAWRPLNLEAPPFNFPPPLRLIDERCPREHSRDQRLGLWRIETLRLW